MIICQSCGAENESHYKFCLGCGADLQRTAPKAPSKEVKDVSSDPRESELKQKLEAMRQRKMSDTPGLIPSRSTPLRPIVQEEASFESLHTMADQDATTVEPLPSVMDGIGYSTEKSGVYGSSAESAMPPPGHSKDANGIGGIDTVRISEEIKAAQPEAKEAAEEQDEMSKSTFVDASDSDPTYAEPIENVESDDDGKTTAMPVPDQRPAFCSECGASIIEGYRFCGNCGADLLAQAVAFEEKPHSEVIAELVFIHPSGEDGERLSIKDSDTVLGRTSEFGLLQSDPHLSPHHVRLVYQDDALYCEDLNSFNGVFTRLKDETVLEHGGMFRIGQQLFLFEEQAERKADTKLTPNECIAFGSPLGSAWGRLSSVCGPKVYGDQWILKTPEVYLGREKGTLTFPDDVFVSGTHCRLKYRDRVCLVEDLGSTNGTYIKRNGRFRVRSQDFLLLGQQLFRVEIAD